MTRQQAAQQWFSRAGAATGSARWWTTAATSAAAVFFLYRVMLPFLPSAGAPAHSDGPLSTYRVAAHPGAGAGTDLVALDGAPGGARGLAISSDRWRMLTAQQRQRLYVAAFGQARAQAGARDGGS